MNRHLNVIKLFAVLLVFSSFLEAFSQDAPIEFGDVDKAMLEMKEYKNDTSADAVILCDYGKLDPIQFHFSRTFRLKILKKSGCNRANFVFRVMFKAD